LPLQPPRAVARPSSLAFDYSRPFQLLLARQRIVFASQRKNRRQRTAIAEPWRSDRKAKGGLAFPRRGKIRSSGLVQKPGCRRLSPFATPGGQAIGERQWLKVGSEAGEEERMEVVFDTRSLAAGKRRQAWRDAICEIYLQVDCRIDPDVEYAGLVREARFGGVTITDAVISPQTIRRGPQHIGRFGKDCYYIGIEHIGAVDIRQSGNSFVLRPGRGSLYYANQPYELQSQVRSRQFWIELPREAFDRRFDAGRPPMLTNIDLSRGLGRIAAEFCSTLALEGGGLDEATRSKLGEQFMDLVALTLSSEPGRQAADDQSVQHARLRSIKAYIEENLEDPNLSLTTIARENGVSLRYLHHLFRLVDMSASEWLRLRRLQRCHDLLISPQHAHQSITEIAYSMGFSSSSHFSNLFRAYFKMRPSDVRGAPAAARQLNALT
jgi:AraC-like DNA-binding protein